MSYVSPSVVMLNCTTFFLARDLTTYINMGIKRLVIGSKNKAKLEEWGRFLGEFVEAVPVGDFDDAEETGESFLENAKIKASHYAKLMGEYVFAEDGGFEVEALGGRPGIRSRRIFGTEKEATDEELVDFILNSLKNSSSRAARLTAAVAISDPEGNIIYTDENSVQGIVPETVEKVSTRGYPYRDLLYLKEIGKLYSKLSGQEHEKVNHKKQLAGKIKEFLRNVRH